MAAGHASPELFDLFSTDDGHFATVDHPSPVLVDTGTQVDQDQLQCGHLSMDARSDQLQGGQGSHATP
eukprot:1329265-Karenia_brevis.AAC.1